MESYDQRLAAGAALASLPVLAAGAGVRLDLDTISTFQSLLAMPGLVLLAALLWRLRHNDNDRRVPAAAALTLLAGHATLGLLLTRGLLPSGFVTLYQASAMLSFGAAMLLAVRLSGVASGRESGEGFGLLAAAAAVTVTALLFTGAYVSGSGAGFACTGWPLCNGALFPAGDRLADINALHRFMAATSGVLIGVLLWRAYAGHRHDRAVIALSLAIAAFYGAEVLAGALWGWVDPGISGRALHLTLATLVWAGLLLLTALTFHPAPGPEQRGPLRTAAAYINLMKPRIIELLLVTTVPAMVLAEHGLPSLWLILGTLIGGTLTAGGANAINCYIDRDIDQVMKRTSRRALPSHRVSPERALTFGVAIGLAGFLELAILINLLSAVLAVSAILFYVFVYTMWLKRTTVQNIVIGGAAGAVPPMVGWAAVTGRVDLPAIVLFAIIFLWTPPHFWALALKYRADYAAAGVPMLPVARGEAETRRQIFIYSLVLVAASLLLYVTGGAGLVYLAVALVLGAALLRMAWQLLRRGDAFPVMKLFGYSITYLAVLFGAMVADQAARSLV